MYLRFVRRKQVFQISKNKSIQSRKPLLVIGDPDMSPTNYIFGRSYECGDTCLDLTGCPGCGNGMPQKIEDFLPTLETDSRVIFISCVLEYVDTHQLEFINKELIRVSGGDLFIVSVDPMSLTAWFYPTRFITNESGPNQVILSEYPETQINYIPLNANKI